MSAFDAHIPWFTLELNCRTNFSILFFLHVKRITYLSIF